VLPSTAKDASKEVVVVPMLEPNVNGYTRSTVKTPNPTNGVKAEVKTELD